MKKIYKYNLSVTDHQLIQLPVDSKLLDIQVQGLSICLWAEIETEKSTQEVIIECFGTGHQLHEDMGIDRVYIATVQQGGFVWHFYKRIN